MTHQDKPRKPGLTGEQRRRRKNQIILTVFSITLIAIWIITMVVKW